MNADGGLTVPVDSEHAIGGLAGSGDMALGTPGYPATLTIGADGADTEYDGIFMGSGSVVKTGPGRLLDHLGPQRRPGDGGDRQQRLPNRDGDV